MKSMVIDLSQTGLEMWLKPHQVELLRIVWDAEGEMDSRTAWKLLGERGHLRSRATVINFLKGAAARGWLEMVQEGAKGGEASLYVPMILQNTLSFVVSSMYSMIFRMSG